MDENHGRLRVLKKKPNFGNSGFFAFFACTFFGSNFLDISISVPTKVNVKCYNFMCQTFFLGVSGRHCGVAKVTVSYFFDLLTILIRCFSAVWERNTYCRRISYLFSVLIEIPNLPKKKIDPPPPKPQKSKKWPQIVVFTRFLADNSKMTSILGFF